eukprot:scaffold120948_cov60-Phaeocystis_antarctica.AAC.1
MLPGVLLWVRDEASSKVGGDGAATSGGVSACIASRRRAPSASRRKAACLCRSISSRCSVVSTRYM